MTKRISIKLLLFIIFLTMAIAGCSSNNSSNTIKTNSNNSGSAFIDIGFREAVVSDVNNVQLTLSGGILTYPIIINLVQNADSYSGTIHDIPPGSGYSFTAEARDMSNTLIFQGAASSVTIYAGQTAQVHILMQETEVTVYNFTPPVIHSIVLSSGTVETGGTITINSSASDPDGDDIFFFWTAPAGSFDSTNSQSVQWTAPQSSGPVNITLSVTDSSGNTNSISFAVTVEGEGTGSANITVEFNTSPVITAFESDPDQLFPDHAMSSQPGVLSTDLSIIASDGDGDGLSYLWTADMSGTFTITTSNSTNWTIANGLPFGICEFRVTVTDDRGGQSIAVKRIAFTENPFVNSTPLNSAPVVNAGMDQTITLSQGSITLNGSASDDGLPAGTLTHNWSLQNGPAGVSFNDSSLLNSTVSFSAPGTYTLRLDASDSELQSTDTVDIIVNDVINPDIWISQDNFADGEHLLGTDNTGIVTINFDVTPYYNNIEGIICYADSSTTITAFGSNNMLIRLYLDGYFDVRNGSDYSRDIALGYSANIVYHVRMVADLSNQTYDVYVTPDGGSEVQIASDYAFRTGAPTMDDVGKVSLVSEDGAGTFIPDQYQIENHTITSEEPPQEPEIDLMHGMSNISSGSTYNAGSVMLNHTDQIEFTIRNNGNVNLNLLSSPFVQVSGTDAGLFTIIQPTSPVLPGGENTFTINFTPTSEGVKNATFTITSNDADEATYVFHITGNCTAHAEVLAFPGAEGFGARVSGGRNGHVIKVTTLASGGSGSLQAALNEPGARIIVFDVSGVINGDINIPHGDVTIAGQTAPGAGITIHGHLTTTYLDHSIENIIIRHIRIRPPAAGWSPDQHDGIQFGGAVRGVILDHIDVSHGIDENVDMWGGPHEVTIQWSLITFPDPYGGHSEGSHNYGLINYSGSSGNGGGSISVHHNLFSHCVRRTPALGIGPAEVLNNVIYNGREGFVHHNPVDGDFNIVGNYYKDGPGSTLTPFWFDPENSNPIVRYFVNNNYVDDPGNYTGRIDNPFNDPIFGSGAVYEYFCNSSVSSEDFNYSTAFDYTSITSYVAVTTQEPGVAYGNVLNIAGAWPRDFVSELAIQETTSRTGLHRTITINTTNLMQGLFPGTAPVDADNDGMADSWEAANGLNPANGSDHNTVMPSGYTAIEEYINELADTIIQ